MIAAVIGCSLSCVIAAVIGAVIGCSCSLSCVIAAVIAAVIGCSLSCVVCCRLIDKVERLGWVVAMMSPWAAPLYVQRVWW